MSRPLYRMGQFEIHAVVVCLFLWGYSPSAALADDAPPLVRALKSQDWPTAAVLLDQHADVGAAETDGTTALHWAAHWGDVPSIERLIEAGANIRAANRYGVQPLQAAAAGGHVGAIERLLSAGADANTANVEGETVLMLVARTGNVPGIKVLLEKGADVNAKEGWRGQTALMWAVIENHPEAAQVLLTAGAQLDTKTKKGYTALLFAVQSGHVEMTRRLLDAGASADSKLPDGTSALVLAALNARWDLGVLLVDRGADPNADGQGWTPLHQIALSRSPHHDNVNPQPIPTGRIDGLEFARTLIEHGADVDRRAKKSPTDGFRQWMRREGATAFLLAAKAADVPLMRLLVASGADPQIPTNRHVTPLAAAAGVGFCQGESPGTEAEALAAVKYALELGGEVNVVDDDGFTPMHGAAARGANSIVQFLYEKGAKLDAKSKKDGWTPLTMAQGVMLADTFKRQLATAEFLEHLQSGANHSQKP